MAAIDHCVEMLPAATGRLRCVSNAAVGLLMRLLLRADAAGFVTTACAREYEKTLLDFALGAPIDAPQTTALLAELEAQGLLGRRAEGIQLHPRPPWLGHEHLEPAWRFRAVRGQQARAPELGKVYFIQAGDGGPIKIGWALDPAERLKRLQTGAGQPLVLLAMVPGTRLTESRLHKVFASFRANGEWFRPGAALLEFVAERRAAAAAEAARAAADAAAIVRFRSESGVVDLAAERERRKSDGG